MNAVSATRKSIETPSPQTGTDRGFDKGPDQIIPKPPAPGENSPPPGSTLVRD